MRALIVFARLAPFVIAFLRDRRRWLVMGKPRRTTQTQHAERARRLTRTVAELGPTFIKLAQVFASRADILPEPYLSAIGELTDRVPALPVTIIENVIAAELGQSTSALFQRFDPEPLAAASLGQVHRASIDGREVVVKVLRPGVEEIVAVDLSAAFRVLSLVYVFFPNHHTRSIATIVSEFAKRIEEEMDFREEAQHAAVIRANLAADPRVRVPDVLPAFTRRRVLVLEYVEGTRVDRLQDRIASGDVDLAALLGTIVEIYLRMMLVDGVFHADPHPGNLLVDRERRVVLLDFGMVVRVERDTRTTLIHTVIAAARQDVDGVVAGLYELGLIDPDVDRGTIHDAARALMRIAFIAEPKPRQIQRIVNEVLSTFYRWPITLPSELVYFGRAAALVEGIGLRYDPAFNSMQFATPVISGMKGQLTAAVLGEPSAMLQDWMGELTGIVRELRDILRRAGRDELRVRVHPRDMIDLQQFVARQTRRLLLGLFVGICMIVATALIPPAQRGFFFGVLLAVLGLIFFVILLVPPHLLANPFRGARPWR